MLSWLAAFMVAGSAALGSTSTTLADQNDEGGRHGQQGGPLRAVPFVFVGSAQDCGGTAGSNIVTSAWLGGMGLPDNNGANGVPATAGNPHLGLLLSKNGPTPDCSSAGARILGAEGTVVTATTTLGYDFRNGGHCGAGAPRFNLTTQDNVLHFIGGCANSTQTPSTQDPQWTRATASPTDPAQAFPPVTPNSRIKSLTLIYDEGTDTPTAQDPNGVGLAVVDNIFVDNRFISAGRGIAPSDNGDRGDPGDNNDHRRGDGHHGNWDHDD